MSSYGSSNRARSARQRTGANTERRRTNRRVQQESRRSVGATSISAPGANALGMSRRTAPRPHGRGETARRVELARTESAASRKESISARPAVYTAEAKFSGLLSRFRIPTVRMPSLAMPSVPIWAFAILALAIAVAIVIGPARNYYVAWREAGILQAEYQALVVQNEELNHEIDRLQTLEGIEDEARSRGYVFPNEEALVVKDIDEGQVADPALIQAAVEEHENSLPWYVVIMDAIFGFKYE